jgi:exodeoxyribonuclease VII large subunit
MYEQTYTVSELAASVGRAVSRAFPDEIWVQGQIRDLSRAASGHVYFTLLDPDAVSDSGAVLPVTLFASDKVAVNRVLARSGAVRMTDGVEVRIRGRLSHYAPRGVVQLRMTWIDTDFTLGKLAAERERLVQSLRVQGLLDRNPGLGLPLVPLQVGLITSAGSAAYADFMDELSRSGYAWRVLVADSRVQGPEAATDIVEALAVLPNRDVDVIALVRGGGATTDLAVFDSEAIALAIARCPIPVVTGIGHETDVSVADLVARNFKTPTACAAGLVAEVSRFAGRVNRLGTATQRAVNSRLAVATADLDHVSARLGRSSLGATERAAALIAEVGRKTTRGSGRRLSRAAETLAASASRLVRGSTRQLGARSAELEGLQEPTLIAARRLTTRAKDRLASAEQRLALLDPARLLARGWSITRTTDGGALVTDPSQVEPGSGLETTVAGGRISSVVRQDGEVADGR